MELRGRDGPILRAIKAVTLLSFRLSVARRRRGQFQRWQLAGDCNGCGVCCERPSIMVDWATWNVKAVRWLFLGWQRVINGFELVATEPQRVFAFQCRYFDSQNRKCLNYESRPGLCRDYPRLLLEQSSPEFYKECSYRVVATNAKSLLRIVNRAELTEEQKAEMKRRLRLE